MCERPEHKANTAMSDHPVVHFEITAEDGDALKGFYGRVFGWPINSDNKMGYGIVDMGATEKPGRINGGVSGSMGMGTGWVTVYIEVPNLEAMLESIGEAGGETLMPPTDIEEGPRIALFKDPAGNMVGLVQAQG